MQTVLVLGDQLNIRIGALASAEPKTHRVLLIESDQIIGSGRHVQRIHLVVAAIRRFARELEDAGFEVDLRRAPTIRDGVDEHRAEFSPQSIIATEPNSRRAHALFRSLGISTVRSNQFLCHYKEFAEWAEGREAVKLEDFYRWTRARLGYLMDGDDPVGGRWNFDHENREPPPDDTSIFSQPPDYQLDDLDTTVIDSLPNTHGAAPVGLWATDRAGALRRLDDFIAHDLPLFGPYEDAMTEHSWNLAHSLLSPYLNIGLLMPDEVVEAAIDAYEDGTAPLQSVEGFLRQVIGWREYVWGLYWLWPDHIESNVLEHDQPVPPVFEGTASTEMRCVATAIDGLRERAYVHHIQRLMVLSNFANLYGMNPKALTEWMWNNFIDGAEWVMVPNVVGMALWADGGRMATKPYISGGAYINRMSDHCSDCEFDPKKRVGPTACPFTTLYWDFMDRHRKEMKANHRMARAVATLDRLSDLDKVRLRAEEVRALIQAGRL